MSDRVALPVSRQVAASTALAVASMSTGAGPATAATGPSNVRGTQPGNADSMVERLCSQTPDNNGLVGGALNINTGEFRTDAQNLQEARRLGYAPNGPWEYFGGYCTYPQSATWSTKGAVVRTTTWIGNHGTTDDRETFVSNYSTKTYAKKSVGASISFSLAKSIFSVGAGGSFRYEWGWEKSSSFERRSEKTIPSCTQVAVTWQPYQRVVRVNPTFNVVSYSWNKNGDPRNERDWTTVNTWRGWGADWQKINSYGNYVDGISDMLLPDGRPDGREDKWQQSLPRDTCGR